MNIIDLPFPLVLDIVRLCPSLIKIFVYSRQIRLNEHQWGLLIRIANWNRNGNHYFADMLHRINGPARILIKPIFNRCELAIIIEHWRYGQLQDKGESSPARQIIHVKPIKTRERYFLMISRDYKLHEALQQYVVACNMHVDNNLSISCTPNPDAQLLGQEIMHLGLSFSPKSVEHWTNGKCKSKHSNGSYIESDAH